MPLLATTAIAASGLSFILVITASFYAIRLSYGKRDRSNYIYIDQRSVEQNLYVDEDGSAPKASQVAFHSYATRIKTMVAVLTLGTTVLAIITAILSVHQADDTSPISKFIFALAWVWW